MDKRPAGHAGGAGRPGRAARGAAILAFAFALSGAGFCEDGKCGTFTVAVAGFPPAGLPQGMALFASTFPRLLIAELAVLPPRLETAEYRAEKASVSSSQTLYASGADLAARLDDLALRSLEPGIDPGKRAQNLSDARSKVDEARKKLEAGSASVPSAASEPVDGTVPSALSALNDKGQLVSLAAGGPRATVAGKDIDLLVYGSLEPVGSYVAVDVNIYDAALGRLVYSSRSYAAPSDPAPLARDLGERICRLVAGRPYARLDLVATPDAAVLSVNGKALDASTRRLYLFEKSTLLVSATAPGMLPLEAAVNVDLGERKQASFELKAALAGTARIDTAPSGLPVYVDGLFAGRSPVELPLSGERSIVAAKADGDASATAILPPGGKVDIVLVPDTSEKDRAALVDKRRDAFYDALGLFVISLPPTSISYGLMGTYADAYIRGADDTMLEKYTASGISLGICGAVNVGLLVNVIFRLIGYIGAAR